MIIGDFNARIQATISEEEECLGNYTFGKTNTTLEHQSNDVADNKERMIRYAEQAELKFMNTVFKKQEQQLITYKNDKSHQ